MSRLTPVLVTLLLGLWPARPVPAAPVEGEPGDTLAGGIAVAPFAALEVEPTTAAILTGIAEGMAMELTTGGRFVAHGELLRAVDSGPDGACRDEDCLARAAAERGVGHLLSGEVGRLGDTYVVTVRLVRCPGAETLATVSRQCGECTEGVLPTLLEDALFEALGRLDVSSPTLSDEGHTVVLALQRRGGASSYDDPYHAVSRSAVTVAGVELSSLTQPTEALGCHTPEQGVRFVATLLANNTAAAARIVKGIFSVEVADESSGEVLIRHEEAVQLHLAGEGDEEAPSSGVVKVEIEAPAGVRTLNVRSFFGDDALEDLRSRPAGRVAGFEDFYLVCDEIRVGELSWGEGMEAHLHLAKTHAGTPAEVTVRLERKIRYWFDTENLQSVYEIPADQTGDFHLILPFVPDPTRRESTEGYHFEVWVNGCQLHRSALFP